MSRISENIRKITKAWGGKTTGNGISDALSDLYNSLPFGITKEVVLAHKEYEVISGDDIDMPSCQLPDIYAQIDSNKIYTVNYNGVNYECPVFVTYDEGDDVTTNWYVLGNTTIVNGETGSNIPFVIMCFPNTAPSAVVITDGSTPEKITLSIETETVKTLPAKFMPEPIVFTTADMQTFTCNKSYEECLKLYQNKVFNAVVDIGVGIYPMTSYMYINDESGEDLCYTLTTSGSQMVIEYSKTGEITIQVVNNV